MRRALAITALALGLILTGCGPGGSELASDVPGDSNTGGIYGDGGGAAVSDLMLADTELGEVVVTADGMTAYMFDEDTQGAQVSACTGACLQNWPPIIVSGDEPMGEGLSGEVGTIETADGEMQVTLNGWPLYLFAGDSAAGDLNGQGVNDVWWAVDAAGEPVRE